MRIYNKSGEQIGVQDNKKVMYWFNKEDRLNPPKEFYIALEPKPKPKKKKEDKEVY